ncbi:MAG: NACHT domain-containing protein [Pseudomonadota bacterium]
MTSTTESGNAFRDLVCDLLRTKYPDLSTEKRISGTKADIRFSREDLGRTEVWAVECKDYTRPLDKGYVSREIHPLYEVMLQRGEIARVLIVTRKGVSTDADEFIRSWKGASHLTYEQLAESLVGLRGYIQHLAGLRATEGGTDYVEARLEAVDGPALQAVEQWARDGDGAGRAILGSYGQGKSSFARRLAAHLATRHLADPTERMPILLRLGEVVHETQLEGLFGKEFTARHPCPGYQFRTLEHLNRSGRLLVVLDGFDEMKHAMTAADFQSNFHEFNRLLVGDAKVLLLGRPNALPSNERELVFRGKTRVADQEVSSSRFAPWPEWKIDFFAEEETRQLLISCLTVFQARHAQDRRFDYPQDFVARRLAEIFAQVPGELLRRPVHVQLVADVAADPNFDLRGFNEHRLYEHFIRTMVERDTVEKQARRAIPLDARLTFQRELAWWAWRRPDGTQGCFFRHEVPAAIMKDLPNGNAVDDEGKRNEYIVSTLTEEKESGVLFFAHRSFQEFLVAERMRLVVPTPAAHADYSNFLTDVVQQFLRQAPDQGFIVEWYKTLQASPGPIALPYLKFFASFPGLLQSIKATTLVLDARDMDPWTALILHHATVEGTNHALDFAQLSVLMLALVKNGKPEAAAVATLSLLRGALAAEDSSYDYARISALMAAILERTLRSARGDTTSGRLTIGKSDADFASEVVASIRKIHPRGNFDARQQLDLSINLENVERICCGQLQAKGKSIRGPELVNPVTMADASTQLGAWVDLPSAQVYRHLDQELSKAHAQFLRGRDDHFVVVPVDVRGRVPGGRQDGRG